MIWSKATSYTICKNCIWERDSQRKPDKSSYVGPEDARNKPRFQDESVSFPKTVRVTHIATSAAVQDSGRTIGNVTVIWSKATSYIQFVKIVFQNEIVKESLINLLMSDQKMPETSLDFRTKVYRFRRLSGRWTTLQRLLLSKTAEGLLEMLLWSGQRLPVIQFVKIVFQNEIVKESLINLLMSDKKTPETSLNFTFRQTSDAFLKCIGIETPATFPPTDKGAERRKGWMKITVLQCPLCSGRTIAIDTVIWSKATI